MPPSRRGARPSHGYEVLVKGGTDGNYTVVYAEADGGLRESAPQSSGFADASRFVLCKAPWLTVPQVSCRQLHASNATSAVGVDSSSYCRQRLCEEPSCSGHGTCVHVSIDTVYCDCDPCWGGTPHALPSPPPRAPVARSAPPSG